jgi:hypothetical protein
MLDTCCTSATAGKQLLTGKGAGAASLSSSWWHGRPRSSCLFRPMIKWLRPLEDLRRIAEGHAQDLLPAHDQLTVVRYRSRAIRIYAVRRANGRCEACDAPAPFITPQGHPYLESHHITRVSDGGPDHPQAVIALCPNCHRRAHYSVDAHTFKQQLEGIIRRKEGLISPSTGREV